MGPSFDPRVDNMRKLPVRRRLLILVLAIVTAITVVLTLLYPPGGVKRTRKACVEDEETRCPGGKSDVILLPAPAPAGSAAAPR